jgi:hypothetical protein
MRVLLITTDAFIIIEYEQYRVLERDPLTVEALKRNPHLARHYNATVIDNTGDEAEIPPVLRRTLSLVKDYR